MKLSIRRSKVLHSPVPKFRDIDRQVKLGPISISQRQSGYVGHYKPYRTSDFSFRFKQAYLRASLNNEEYFSCYWSFPKGWVLGVISRSCYGHHPMASNDKHCDIRGHFTPRLEQWRDHDVLIREFGVWSILKLLPFIKEY